MFALVQLHEWQTKSFGIGSSSYGSLYFLTTGLHEAHVIVGVLILDLGVQSSQVANQARIHALDPTARSRLNTVFMATMILGGACGGWPSPG